MNRLVTIKVALITAGLVFAFNAAAKSGKHNDKYCYVTMAGGSQTHSPCSARGTTCNPDNSCSIDGVPGIGEQKDGVQKARSKSKLVPKPIKKKPMQRSSGVY